MKPEEREKLLSTLVICSNSAECNAKHLSCGHRGPHDKKQDCDESCPLVGDAKCLPRGQVRKDQVLLV